MNHSNNSSRTSSNKDSVANIQYGIIAVSTTAIFLNVFVAAVLLNFSKLLKRRSNKFLLNLILSNAVIGVMNIVMPISVLLMLRTDNPSGKPTLPPVYMTMTLVIIMELSMLNLILLSLDRLLTINWTFRYLDSVNTKQIHMVITIPWLLTSLFSAAMATVYVLQKKVIDQFLHISFDIVASIGLLTLVLSNTTIFIQARKQLTSIAKTSVHEYGNAKQKDRSFKVRECRVAFINIGIVVKFIVCWLPMVINVTYRQLKKGKMPAWFDTTAVYLKLVNLVMDPIIFVLLSRDVRRQISKIFPCLKSSRKASSVSIPVTNSNTQEERLETMH